MLCYVRLECDRYISDETRSVINEHIMKNRLGYGNGSSFYSIFALGGSDLSYLERYISIIGPDREEISEMISALSPRDVYAMSYLIERSNALSGDELML